MRSYYEVLGIGPWATHEQLRLAYLTRAHELHPDLHHGAPPMVLSRLTEEMAAVNEAWRVLGDEASRRDYDVRHMGVVRREAPTVPDARGVTGWRSTIWRPTRPEPPGPRVPGTGSTARGYGSTAPNMPRPDLNDGVPPGVAPPAFDPDSPTGLIGGARVKVDRPGQLPRPAAPLVASPRAPQVPALSTPDTEAHRRSDRCKFCGSTPAAVVTLRGSRPGLFESIFAPGRAVHGPLCRCCGLAVFRELTDFALSGGGGGPGLLGVGLLLTWLTAAGNLAMWLRIRLLGSPRRAPGARAPLLEPLDPGPSLLVRHGIRLVYAVLLAGGLLVATSVVLAHE